MSRDTDKPLKGLRVLDLSQGIAGPYCGSILAQQGADVIKAEPPGGDWARVMGPARDGFTAIAIAFNTGKRSVCGDTGKPEGRAVLARIGASVDIIIQNFRPGVAEKLDWSQAMRLEFEPPDLERFPALRLGLEVAKAGGTAGAVVNAANEMAVAAFLAGELSFREIVPLVQSVLENHHFDPSPTLDQLLAADRWARQEASRWVCA